MSSTREIYYEKPGQLRRVLVLNSDSDRKPGQLEGTRVPKKTLESIGTDN